jgi:hypothetical protein
MRARPLRDQNKVGDDEDSNDRRSKGAAGIKPAFVDGLIKKITEGCPKGPGKVERCPEQKEVGDLRVLLKNDFNERCA